MSPTKQTKFYDGDHTICGDLAAYEFNIEVALIWTCSECGFQEFPAEDIWEDEAVEAPAGKWATRKGYEAMEAGWFVSPLSEDGSLLSLPIYCLQCATNRGLKVKQSLEDKKVQQKLYQQAILTYWFGEPIDTLKKLPKSRIQFWFRRDPKIDQEIKEKFEKLYQEAISGQLKSWQDHPQGRLALIILLDQFSRNLFRDNPKAFDQDSAALKLCLEGIALVQDRKLSPYQRKFFYMPMMHSEDLVIQKKSLEIFKQLAEVVSPEFQPDFKNTYDFARRHYEVIKRFGRFPHRNQVLGRISTAEEENYLAQGKSF